MRIIHICNLPLPPDHPDYGKFPVHPGRWVLNLAIAQMQTGDMDVEVVVQIPGSTGNFSTTWDGVPVHFLAAPDRLRSATLFYWDAARIGRFVRKLRPDIVHAHGTEDANVLAAQWTGLPHVTTVQGCYFMINAQMPPPWISRATIVEWTEAFALRRERDVIAKSDYVGRAVGEKFPHLRIHRIPNTFDARLLDFPLASPRSGFVFVGMITPRKGLDTLAEALESDAGLLGSESLHIVGNLSHGAGDYETAILSRLRHHLGDRLVLHGRVPALEAARIVHGCRVLLAPSLEEMFGNQLIEALLLGVWPVVSTGTAMSENVERFGCGTIFEVSNPAALRNAIKSLPLDGWDRRETQSRVVSDMGPGQVARRHENLYADILNPNNHDKP